MKELRFGIAVIAAVSTLTFPTVALAQQPGAAPAQFAAAVMLLFLATNFTESVATKATNMSQLLLTLCIMMHARNGGRGAFVAQFPRRL